MHSTIHASSRSSIQTLHGWELSTGHLWCRRNTSKLIASPGYGGLPEPNPSSRTCKSLSTSPHIAIPLDTHRSTACTLRRSVWYVKPHPPWIFFPLGFFHAFGKPLLASTLWLTRRLRRGSGLLWMRRSSSLLSWLLGNEVPGGVVIAFYFYFFSSSSLCESSSTFAYPLSFLWDCLGFLSVSFCMSRDYSDRWTLVVYGSFCCCAQCLLNLELFCELVIRILRLFSFLGMAL
jgi:hypothetical protein